MGWPAGYVLVCLARFSERARIDDVVDCLVVGRVRGRCADGRSALRLLLLICVALFELKSAQFQTERRA